MGLVRNPTTSAPNEDSLQRTPYTTHAVLSDGGVYDNLGLETVFKRCQTVLCSDAGGQVAPDAKPKRNWGHHTMRVLHLIDNQVRSLRKRTLIDSYRDGSRLGAFWGIRTDIRNYGLADALECRLEHTRALSRVPTRLARLDALVQERLINWGYAVSDAALRTHAPDILAGAPARAFPYPNALVG